MKTHNQARARLKLEVETLRNLQEVDLENVVGGAERRARISLSVGCNCESKKINCPG